MTSKFREALDEMNNGMITARHFNTYKQALLIAERLESGNYTIDNCAGCSKCEELKDALREFMAKQMIEEVGNGK